MRYSDFERIMSPQRMSRYLASVANNSKRAMVLYRKNLKLSQQLFTVISCFEITLRNAIDNQYNATYGAHWLRDSTLAGGIFTNPNCSNTAGIITRAITKLGPNYSHAKLLAEMDFGFWRYLFASPQYNAGGRILLHVFPSKPVSTPAIQYNQRYTFNQLELVNELRNRIAHHEPICFQPGTTIKSTNYARQRYNLILQLFQWMNINESSFLYGLDHVITTCDEIDTL